MDEINTSQLSEIFSQRDLEILRLIKQGLSNRAIAEKLNFTLGTVKWYNRQIFAKLDVNSRTQAIEKAEEMGLIGAKHIQSPEGEAFLRPTPRSKHNLPVSLTSFIGRKKECTDLRTLLHSSTTRLVTILGAGGVGKTRLALRVAEEALPMFPHGVWLVDLAPAVDPALVPQFFAKSLGISDSSGWTFEEALVCYLSPKSLLLVIDNCEHMIKACARLVAYLLTRCQHLRILATSREAIGVEGEVQYVLPPLSFPNPGHLPGLKQLRRFDAVQLLVERASLACPGFTITEENSPSIMQICWRVDGIPLALELAAARMHLFSVEQIAAHLNNCFSLLSSSEHPVIARFQTMRAVLDWSFQLLNNPEQVLLRRLAVFIGGWTFEAAEHICGDKNPCGMIDLLNQLVNKSLVIAFPNVVTGPELESIQQTRYRLLEPIRQYAFEKVEQFGELEWLRDRHLAYFRELAERTMSKPFQHRWNRQYKFLKHDLENLREALEWGLSAAPNSQRLDDGLHLLSALGPFWGQAGLNREGIAWLEKALLLTQSLDPSSTVLRAHLLDECGFLYYMQANYQKSRQMLEESITLFRQCGDDWKLIMPLVHLSVVSSHIDQPRALSTGDESVRIARQVGDPLILAEVLFWRGEIAQKIGKPEEAPALAQESLDLFWRMGERGEACRPLVLLWICSSLMQKGDTASLIYYRDMFIKYRQEMEDIGFEYYVSGIEWGTSYFLGNYKEMEEILQALLDKNLDQNQASAIWYSRNLGVALKCQGKYQRGAAASYQSLLLAMEVNNTYGMCCALANLADIAAITGKPYQAARLLGAVDTLVKSIPRWLEQGPDHDCFEHGVLTARELLSEQEYAQAWEEGRLLTFERAIQEARMIIEVSTLLSS